MLYHKDTINKMKNRNFYSNFLAVLATLDSCVLLFSDQLLRKGCITITATLQKNRAAATLIQ